MSSVLPESPLRTSDPRITRIAWTLIAAFFVFMVWFGIKYHPIEEVNSGEWDDYVGQADVIRQGHLPADPYRPLLYPITAAGLGACLGDTFAGARLASSLFAAVFVLSAFLIGRRMYSPAVGLFAAGAMMLNHNVIRFGVHATTDMMFAGLAGMTVYATLRNADDPEGTSVVPVSLGLALAYFTRYTAIALLPCVLVAILCSDRAAPPRRVVRRLLAFVLWTFVFLTPHFVLTYMVFGNPFHNENWRNLAFKLYGNWDWTYLSHNPFHGTFSVIAHDPARFVTATIREVMKFGYRTLIHLGGYSVAGWLFTACTLAGLYSALRAINRQRLVLLTFLAGYVLTICAFFYTSPRFMLPVLPACYVLGGAWMMSTAFPGSFTIKKWRVGHAAPVLAAFLLIDASATAREMPVFVASHPTEELRAVQQLEHQYGTNITVLGTAPYFQRHLSCTYLVLKSPAPGDMDFYARLSELAKNADFVVIGRLTARGFPAGLVDGTAPPPFLDAVEIDDHVSIYRMHKTEDSRRVP